MGAPHFDRCPAGKAPERAVQAMRKAGEPLTLIEIGRKAGCSSSSVRKVLAALEKQGKARRHPILSGGVMDFWELIPETQTDHA